MESIIVHIDSTGAIQYEVKGVKGRKCTDLTKAIDQLANVVETKKTAEFYQAATEAQRVQNKQ